MIKEFKIGDRIVFKAACRYSYKKVTRIVKHIDGFGRPEVGYNGYSNFIVMHHEILDVIAA